MGVWFADCNRFLPPGVCQECCQDARCNEEALLADCYVTIITGVTFNLIILTKLQLWDKSYSHGFHDLQLCAINFARLACLGSVKYARKCLLYGFPCEMDFSHHKSPNRTRLRGRDSESSGEKFILHEKPYKMPKLKIVKTLWDGFISQLFSTWGKFGSMRKNNTNSTNILKM